MFGWKRLCPLLLVWIVLPAYGEGPPREDAVAAIRQASEAYAEAWRQNDREAVMATLTDDAVLLPPGMSPLEGTEEIERFWWPDDGPSSTITGYESVIDELEFRGDLAFVRGHSSLSFRLEDSGEVSQRQQDSHYLMILRKTSDGEWKISRRMWARR